MAVYTELIMGLPFSLHVRSKVTPDLDRAVAEVWSDLRRHDDTFSPYKADSIVSKLRRGELLLEPTPAEVVELLELAEHAREMTGGAFDVSYDGRLEPCGAVKGWAAEEATRHLAPLGLDYYLNAGGDIIVHSADDPWRVGIEHPADPTGLLAVLSLHNGAVATSGVRQRGSHIVDPRTRRAATMTDQVTVIGPCLTTADIAATALAVTGNLHGIDPGWIRGYEVLLVRSDGHTAATAGITRYLAADQAAPSITVNLDRNAAAPRPLVHHL